MQVRRNKAACEIAMNVRPGHGLQALRRFDGTIIVSDVSPEKPRCLRMGSCHETVYRVGATPAVALEAPVSLRNPFRKGRSGRVRVTRTSHSLLFQPAFPFVAAISLLLPGS